MKPKKKNYRIGGMKEIGSGLSLYLLLSVLSVFTCAEER